jgi:HAD superfamily hydrolase (TIGR01509 family)
MLPNEGRKVSTFLFDLDGVIRIYDDNDTSLLETRHGLELGTIDKVAFSNDLLDMVTTGKLKRDEWVRMVGIRMNNLPAALEWENRPVHVDNEILSTIRDLKSRGFQIFLITNGTDNLLNELRNLGIEKEFTHIFNSSELGIAKPSPEIYRIVLKRYNLNPENIAYIDDNKQNIAEAQKLGIESHHYHGISALEEWLKAISS